MEIGLIYKAMAAAMADIGAVSKAQTNQQQHFRYRGIDDAMNALYPVLAKHGLFLVPEVLDQRREERTTKSGGNLIYSILKVRYTMYASDGSSVSAVVIGEGMDSADKSSNKAIAAAMKYAIFQMFCIPTEDMRNDDPDKTQPDESFPTDGKKDDQNVSPCDYNPENEIRSFIDRLNMTKEEFVRCWNKAIEIGEVTRKAYNDMRKSDWVKLFRSVQKIYQSAA